jgi:hypothetical protein
LPWEMWLKGLEFMMFHISYVCWISPWPNILQLSVLEVNMYGLYQWFLYFWVLVAFYQWEVHTIDWRKKWQWKEGIGFCTTFPMKLPWSSFVPHVKIPHSLMNVLSVDSFLCPFQPMDDNNLKLLYIYKVREA